MDCGHLTLYACPRPEPGDWLWCTRCDRGVQVVREPRNMDHETWTMDHGPRAVLVLPRGRRRQFVGRRTRATDWASGPAASVELSCGHVLYYRPPSPARGDRITCGWCGASVLVLKPVRRSDRHGGPWTDYELDVPEHAAAGGGTLRPPHAPRTPAR